VPFLLQFCFFFPSLEQQKEAAVLGKAARARDGGGGDLWRGTMVRRSREALELGTAAMD
jgi:hypothetical protein